MMPFCSSSLSAAYQEAAEQCKQHLQITFVVILRHIAVSVTDYSSIRKHAAETVVFVRICVLCVPLDVKLKYVSNATLQSFNYTRYNNILYVLEAAFPLSSTGCDVYCYYRTVFI